MIVEYTRYKIPVDRSAAFEEAYRQAAEQLANSPHCLAYELSRCTEEPERYVLRIEWKSIEEHLQGFRKDPGFKDFFKLVQPFFSKSRKCSITPSPASPAASSPCRSGVGRVASATGSNARRDAAFDAIHLKGVTTKQATPCRRNPRGDQSYPGSIHRIRCRAARVTSATGC